MLSDVRRYIDYIHPVRVHAIRSDVRGAWPQMFVDTLTTFPQMLGDIPSDVRECMP